jgi:galactose mutarotase-like enzyme
VLTRKHAMFMVNALLGLASVVTLPACSQKPSETSKSRPAATELDTGVGGRKVVVLSQPRSRDLQPRILRAELLPGRGMSIFQLTADVPGTGAVDLLDSPPLETLLDKVNDGGPEDFNGNLSLQMGGATLLPFAGPIRGKLLPDGKTIETTVLGKPVRLPANGRGMKAHAELHAVGGLILATRMDNVSVNADQSQASVTATLDAGGFQGHWLSKAAVVITATLQKNSFDLTATVKNAGSEEMPMGIGWRPYFHLLSGDRTQAKLHLPARQRVAVNNYDDLFPTGQLMPVASTPYDFSAPGGAPLNDLFLDDCFVDLQRDDQGSVAAEVIDSPFHFGIRIRALSPQVSAFQVYAPTNQPVVVVEPRFDWGDPFNPVWKGKSAGMVVLKPGESIAYSVEIDLFTL